MDKMLNAGLALALMVAFPSALQADPRDFFPSVPLYEEDELPNEFDLNAEGCAFELTEYRSSRAEPRSIIRIRFDLSYYDTDPALVYGPMPFGSIASRHTVAWFVTGLTDVDLAPVNKPLQDVRLSSAERDDTNLSTAREKQARLIDLLAEMQAGAFGPFAAHNHWITYVVNGADLEITGARVASRVDLPVRREDGQALIDAMHTYRLANCPEGQGPSPLAFPQAQ